jgi:hypothetical protein
VFPNGALAPHISQAKFEIGLVELMGATNGGFAEFDGTFVME